MPEDEIEQDEMTLEGLRDDCPDWYCYKPDLPGGLYYARPKQPGDTVVLLRGESPQDLHDQIVRRESEDVERLHEIAMSLEGQPGL